MTLTLSSALLVVLLLGVVIWFALQRHRQSRHLRDQEVLIHAISHEIRTPLARMRYRLAMLKQSSESEDIIEMEHDIAELDALVEEILLYARLDEAAPPINVAEYDIDEIVAKLVDDIKMLPIAQGKSITVESRSMVLLLEPGLVRRALQNLLINALRYGDGKVHLSVTVKAKKLSLIVEDNGKGIPESEYHKVLRPFLRLEQSRSRETGGVGLGLAIVNRVAKAHGGEIQIGRAALGGAKFSLLIPIKMESR